MERIGWSVIPVACSLYSGLPPSPEPQNTQTLVIALEAGVGQVNEGNVLVMVLEKVVVFCQLRERTRDLKSVFVAFSYADVDYME